ncbi:serine-threonine kinase receptor-associated protein [Hydra vulgaris]|uniref:Serine-threonine kinase receptor-associated protein n=1 Tax=Hydra vulgaris TaxID=6087 RepID=T2M2N0_HYDVU
MSVKQIPLTCPGHTRPVVDLAFSDVTDYGYFLISACKDGKPMLRHGHTGDWIGTFDGHKGAVWGATLNKKATLAATAAADYTAKVWDALKGTELFTFTHNHIVKTVDFSKDEDRLLTGSNNKTMRLFDLSCPDKEPYIIEGLGGNPKACIWLNNDTNILSGCDEKTVRLWDVRSFKQINTIVLDKPLTGLELSKDQSTLSVVCGNQALFYDSSSLSLLKSYELKTVTNSISLSPKKNIFVTGGEDFLLYKFDFNTGIQLEAYHGHFGPVHCVRFSPDGELYASGSEDGTLRLWQTIVGKTYGLWKAQGDEEDPKLCVNEQNLCSEVAVES